MCKSVRLRPHPTRQWEFLDKPQINPRLTADERISIKPLRPFFFGSSRCYRHNSDPVRCQNISNSSALDYVCLFGPINPSNLRCEEAHRNYPDQACAFETDCESSDSFVEKDYLNIHKWNFIFMKFHITVIPLHSNSKATSLTYWSLRKRGSTTNSPSLTKITDYFKLLLITSDLILACIWDKL